MGSIITFYSYKGGVGRTMALANTAALLASRGLRVLAIDWDLEAPGLHNYYPNTSGTSSAGIIDILETDSTWKQSVSSALGIRFHLDIIRAGVGKEGYEQKVLEFNWYDFYTNRGGADRLEALRNEWLEAYDFVLIDSRTGITDVSGICTAFMPDIVVAVITANEQCLTGTKYMIEKIESVRQRLHVPRAPVFLVPLISRWDGREEQEEATKWFDRIRNALGNAVEDWLPRTVKYEHFFSSLRVPHVAYFSFGEKLPVLTHGTDDPELPGYYFSKLADVVESLSDEDADLENILDPKRTSRDAKKVFVSGVTGDMGQFKVVVREALTRKGFEVLTRDEFISVGTNILERTDEFIHKADLSIFLIGEEAGELAHKGDKTYLEYEIDSAIKSNIPVYLMVLDTERTRGNKQLIIHRFPERVKHLFENAHALRTILENLPTGSSGPTNLPFPSIRSLFKGRERELEQLSESLRQDSKIAQTSAVTGLGGVGKTRLAVEFAWRNSGKHSATLFVSAGSYEEMNRGLAELSSPLCLDLPEYSAAEDEVRVAATLKWLRQNSGWLLIFDNADNAEVIQHIERITATMGSGKIIITSRFANWPSNFTQAQLDTLAISESVSYLLEQTTSTGSRGRKVTRDEKFYADELAQLLGGLPLALEQAAAFISQRRLSFEAYIEKLRKRDPSKLFDHQTKLNSVWQTTFEQLAKVDRVLLNTLSWFAPDPIPIDILSSHVELLPNSGEWTEDQLFASLAQLADYSLIHWNNQNDTVSVHRLVQQFLRRQQENDKRGLQATLEVLNCLEKGDPTDSRSWQVWEQVDSHIVSAITNARVREISDPTKDLMGDLGTYFWSRARYDDAVTLTREALNYEELASGESPKTATRLNNLAQMLVATNRLSEAEPLMQRALAIDESSYGSSHKEVTSDLNNLASLLLATNRLAEAEPLMRRALKIGEESLGAKHPNVATALNNLAQLLIETKRLGEAEPLIRRALAIDVENYGRNHSRVAVTLSNLAQLLRSTNRFAEAEPLLRRALAIDEESYGGENHPTVAIRLNNLAQLLYDTDRLKESEMLMRRALEIDQSSLGKVHPNVAVRLNNLAQLLQATKRLEEAEPLLRRAIEINQSYFGESHPQVATGLNNLASLLKSTNRLEEAEQLMRRALEIDQSSLGKVHPNVAVRLNNLAQLLQATKRLEEAEQLLRRAIEINQSYFGESHPQVATGLNNLASLLESTNQLEEAEPLLRRAIEITKSCLGVDHPNTRVVVTNYVHLLSAQDLSESEMLSRISGVLMRESVASDSFTKLKDLKDKQDISLGTKQTEFNPWDEVTQKYPEGAQVKGTVRHLTNYGAFIELEEGVDGLLHVSDMSWNRKISHASEVMKKGDEIECLVISVDEERKRIALGLKQLSSDPWETDIPQKYQPGAIVQGVVTKITIFGVFVELEDELEGLLHISELADNKVENPEDIVKVGENLDVKILRVDTDDRKIGLSRKLEEPIEEEAVAGDSGETSSAPRKELMGGTGGNAPLFTMPSESTEASDEEASSEEDSSEE